MQTIDVIVRDCINAIMAVRTVTPSATLSPELIAKQTREHIDKMSGRALAAGIARENVQAMTQAMVCVADCLACKNKNGLASYWREHPLQQHYFASAKPSAFFDDLERARKANDEALVRVFATALAFGYRGHLRAGEAEKLLGQLAPYVPTQRRLGRGAWHETKARLSLGGHRLLLLPAVAVVMAGVLYVVLGSIMRGQGAALIGAMDAMMRAN